MAIIHSFKALTEQARQNVIDVYGHWQRNPDKEHFNGLLEVLDAYVQEKMSLLESGVKRRQAQKEDKENEEREENEDGMSTNVISLPLEQRTKNLQKEIRAKLTSSEFEFRSANQLIGYIHKIVQWRAADYFKHQATLKATALYVDGERYEYWMNDKAKDKYDREKAFKARQKMAALFEEVFNRIPKTKRKAWEQHTKLAQLIGTNISKQEIVEQMQMSDADVGKLWDEAVERVNEDRVNQQKAQSKKRLNGGTRRYGKKRQNYQSVVVMTRENSAYIERMIQFANAQKPRSFDEGAYWLRAYDKAFGHERYFGAA